MSGFFSRLFALFAPLLAAWMGRREGRAEIQAQEVKEAAEVSHAVVQAQGRAPLDRPAVSRGLRRGEF